MNASLIANYVTAARRVVYLELYQKDYATGEDWHNALMFAKQEEQEALTALTTEPRLLKKLKGKSLNRLRGESGYSFLNQMKNKYKEGHTGIEKQKAAKEKAKAKIKVREKQAEADYANNELKEAQDYLATLEKKS